MIRQSLPVRAIDERSNAARCFWRAAMIFTTQTSIDPTHRDTTSKRVVPRL